MSRIIIGADIVPNKCNMSYFEKGKDYEIIGEDLANVLKEADVRVFNLETVFLDHGEPIKKSGPCLRASEKSFTGVVSLNPTILTVANNHFMDYGIAGYETTLKLLQENEINYVGAGRDLAEATKPLIWVLDNGLKLGIYACVEHEFTIATEKTPGCNPYDPLESYDHIAKLKENCDILVVLYHGGKELYQYGSPMLQKACRKFVEKGADIVLCQHSHCIGAMENYCNGTIIYGQGNFIFGNDTNALYNTGLLVDISIDGKVSDFSYSVNYIPVERIGNRVDIAKNKESIISAFENRSALMLDKEFVQSNYRKFANSLCKWYCLWGLGDLKNNIVFKIINKITRKTLFTDNFTGQNALDMMNVLQCESHREIFLEYLRDRINPKQG